MDILSHGLWAGAGAMLLERKVPIDRTTRWGIVATAVAPDIVPLLPLLAWALATAAPLETAYLYTVATPATEPALPHALTLVIHHLHCSAHSAVVAAAATACAWIVLRCFPMALLGWWSHVLLDIPTHSADYYPVSVFYPLADIGVDGIAWTQPWFLAANYTLLALAYMLLLRHRRTATGSS
jgi:hypothetical protein